MLNKFRNALYNVVGGMESIPALRDVDGPINQNCVPKFPYSRPHFLLFTTDEEIQWSADHHLRPIIVPRDFSKLPWNSGYAEAVNAGKSKWNEDQACMKKSYLQRPEFRSSIPSNANSGDTDNAAIPEHLNAASCLPYVYFGMFDGHAGVGAALAAANQLHHILHEKLVVVLDHLLPPLDNYPAINIESTTKRGTAMWFPEKDVSKESLIVGALESSFWDMDQLIGEDKEKYHMKGGCTALVALFILGKVYVANAGDSRAVLCRNNIAVPLSNDFTPETERQRIRHLAALQPHLLGGEFTHLDYNRKLSARDLGKRVLYRDAYMTGWAYKTVTPADLKFPVVFGEGKRSRVLATIGVTRGFGDHDLKALYCNIPIKPFLMSQPEVQIFDLEKEEIKDSDVLVMGTDGLWDVTSNEKAAEIVKNSLDHFPAHEISRHKYRYISAAQDLVMHSRGKLQDENWRTAEGKAAAIDDISVFVIPLSPYKEEYMMWKQQYDSIHGMHDTDSSAIYGKLSMKSSPTLVNRNENTHGTLQDGVKDNTYCKISEKASPVQEKSSEIKKSLVSSKKCGMNNDHESTAEVSSVVSSVTSTDSLISSCSVSSIDSIPTTDSAVLNSSVSSVDSTSVNTLEPISSSTPCTNSPTPSDCRPSSGSVPSQVFENLDDVVSSEICGSWQIIGGGENNSCGLIVDEVIEHSSDEVLPDGH